MTWNKTIWSAVALTIAGPVSYVLTMGVPFLANTGLLILALSVPGAILGLWSASQLRTRRSAIVATVNTGLALFFVLGFFLGSRVPSSGSGIAKGASAPDFQLSDHNGQTVRLSDELARGPVLLVFYRGHWWPFCVSELGQLRQAHQSIVEAGGRLLAVSVDQPEDSARTVQKLNLPFPILADVDRKVIKDYSLVHPGGGIDGSDIAIPAHFLIGTDGRISYRYVAKRIQDRPNPDADLSALIALKAK